MGRSPQLESENSQSKINFGIKGRIRNQFNPGMTQDSSPVDR